MRIRDFSAMALCLAAVPAFAQSPKDVSGPWTLTPAMVACTDLPIVTKPIPRLVVKAPQTTDDRLAVTTGQQLVIGRSPDDGLAVGQRYTASRLNRDAQYFPRPGEGFGGLRVTGFITVTAINEWNALADVDFACDGVQVGDYLEPFVETNLPSTAAANLYPDFSDRGSILFASDNRTIVGHGEVVSIDRGTAQGVAVGARFAVYRDKHNPNGSPLVYLGDVVVMSTTENTSKVVVTKAVDAIESGDTVVPRRLTTPKQ
jgi:hypothetical protein